MTERLIFLLQFFNHCKNVFTRSGALQSFFYFSSLIYKIHIDNEMLTIHYKFVAAVDYNETLHLSSFMQMFDGETLFL